MRPRRPRERGLRRALDPLRRVRRTEEGMTLVELVVAMSILGVVLLVFTSVLASVQRGVVRQDSLSQTLDSARLAIQQLDRELRSGNVLYDPALENALVGTPGRIASCSGCLPGFTLRVYTQTNADTRGPTPYRCVLWKIEDQQLMTRWWPPGVPNEASGWRIVATGIVNRDLSPATVAFVLDPDPLKGGRTINVVYAANADLEHHPTQTATVQASLTGRNTSYGYPGNVCQSTPTG